jgi:hypothetical protein
MSEELYKKVTSTQGKKIHELLKENKKLRIILRDLTNSLVQLNKVLKQQEETKGKDMNEDILEPTAEPVSTEQEAVEAASNREGSAATEEIVVQFAEDIGDDLVQ